MTGREREGKEKERHTYLFDIKKTMNECIENIQRWIVGLLYT